MTTKSFVNTESTDRGIIHSLCFIFIEMLQRCGADRTAGETTRNRSAHKENGGIGGMDIVQE